MIEPSLQSTLREKYNIRDRLVAEGKFVGLMGNHAANLVCLGLTISSFYVANVVLSEDVIDYDIVSIIPLPVLSLSAKNGTKEIEVRSLYKPTQVYQLCWKSNEPEVWEKFASNIGDLYTYGLNNTWYSTSLHVPYSTHQFSQKDANNNNNSSSSSSNNNNNNSSSNNNNLMSHSSEFQSFNPSAVKFDNFVNDAAGLKAKEEAGSGIRGMLKKAWSFLLG